MRIAIDANMLLAIANEKIDVFGQIRDEFGKTAEIIIPRQVIDELKILSKRNKKNENAVKIAMQEIEKNDARIREVNAKNADEALIALAREGTAVATNDSALKKEVKKLNAGIIFTRKGRFLAFSSMNLLF
ncbi:MAG: hypothetical protein HYW05_04095 [Candidatus Diapherotrites archaeon]|nr:hypothetical protein [Candidatus Diapherotrites archaeon]